MSAARKQDDLIEVHKTYTSSLDGRIVVVEDVPFMIDTETQEEYLEPLVSQRLFDLVRQPEQRDGQVTADLYRWKRD
ncbi:MAG: hypothetical protein HC933_02760 [Pleurocapsa sp. SU_196_0]|nr:hypothetical protein [Pleurocapsa sp. SU_196_0]